MEKGSEVRVDRNYGIGWKKAYATIQLPSCSFKISITMMTVQACVFEAFSVVYRKSFVLMIAISHVRDISTDIRIGTNMDFA